MYEEKTALKILALGSMGDEEASTQTGLPRGCPKLGTSRWGTALDLLLDRSSSFPRCASVLRSSLGRQHHGKPLIPAPCDWMLVSAPNFQHKTSKFFQRRSVVSGRRSDQTSVVASCTRNTTQLLKQRQHGPSSVRKVLPKYATDVPLLTFRVLVPIVYSARQRRIRATECLLLIGWVSRHNPSDVQASTQAFWNSQVRLSALSAF